MLVDSAAQVIEAVGRIGDDLADARGAAGDRRATGCPTWPPGCWTPARCGIGREPGAAGRRRRLRRAGRPAGAARARAGRPGRVDRQRLAAGATAPKAGAGRRTGAACLTGGRADGRFPRGRAADSREARAALPPALAEALPGTRSTCARQRDLSAHTVRGYVTDAVALLDHLARRGGEQPHDLDLAVLRSWLAQGRARGHSRATIARHAASARSFTAWLRRAGLAPDDVGLRLVSPRAHRTLPDVLAPDQARAVVESTAGAGGAGRPAGRGRAGAALRQRDPGQRARGPGRRRRRPRAPGAAGPRQGPQGAQRPLRHARRAGAATPG